MRAGRRGCRAVLAGGGVPVVPARAVPVGAVAAGRGCAAAVAVALLAVGLLGLARLGARRPAVGGGARPAAGLGGAVSAAGPAARRPRRSGSRRGGWRRGGCRAGRASASGVVSGPPLAPPLIGCLEGGGRGGHAAGAVGAAASSWPSERGAGGAARAADLAGGDGGDEVALAHAAGAGDAQLGRQALQLGQQHPGQAVAAAAGAARRPRSGRCLARAGGVLRAGHGEVGGFAHVQVLPCGDLRVPAQGVPRSVRSGPEAGAREERVEKCGADQRRREIVCFGPARGSPEWAATP